MTRVKVLCTVEVEVQVSEEWDDHRIKFVIEENGCPGTGLVGEVIAECINECIEDSTCWACVLKGKNKIIEISRELVE